MNETIKFSQLTAVTSINSGSIFPLVQSGENVSTTFESIKSNLNLNSISGNLNVDGTITTDGYVAAENATFTYANSAALDNHRDSLLLGDSVRIVVLDTVSGGTRTLSASDYGKKLRCSAAGGCEITVPNDIGVSGEYVILRRLENAGPLTLSLGGSVSVDGSAKIADVGEGMECALMATGLNTYDLI
jgi:hypothetical protein